MNLSGPATLGSFYTAGDGAALLLDTNGNGPWASDIFTPDTPTSGAWAFDAPANFGPSQLVGVIDNNGNGLFDGADVWGAYVTAPDTNGNPILVGSGDESGLEIQIPIEAGSSPLNVVPYSVISGSVSMAGGGTFDDLSAGSTVYVAALKYRPSVDASVTALMADAYDVEVLDWSALTGQSSASYTMVVPSNSIVYLWAYADEDVDGFVNETGEAVASAGQGANGSERVGTSNLSRDFNLGYTAR